MSGGNTTLCITRRLASRHQSHRVRRRLQHRAPANLYRLGCQSAALPGPVTLKRAPMAALPALPWGRAPSPPPKRARTDGGAAEGEAAAAAPAVSVWAGMAAKAPSAYGLEAGARLEARPSRKRRFPPRRAEQRPLFVRAQRPAAQARPARAASRWRGTSNSKPTTRAPSRRACSPRWAMARVGPCEAFQRAARLARR